MKDIGEYFPVETELCTYSVCAALTGSLTYIFLDPSGTKVLLISLEASPRVIKNALNDIYLISKLYLCLQPRRLTQWKK